MDTKLIRRIDPSLVYAGIGSAGTPAEISQFMEHLGYRIARAGYTLRTGATQACRESFLAGCQRASGRSETWLPWAGFGGHLGAAQLPDDCHHRLAVEIHDVGTGAGNGATNLYGYRIGMVLGPEMAQPAQFLVCWTPDGCECRSQRTARTGTAVTSIIAAEMFDVPVFNLQNADAGKRLAAFLSAARDARYRAQHTQRATR